MVTQSYVNNESHKYLLRKIDKELKEAHDCDSMQVMINYIDFFKIMTHLGYLSKDRTVESQQWNWQQMLDLWDIMWGAGSHDEDSMKMVNAKRLVCALEGISTNKLLKKSIQYNAETFRDENNNFFADDNGVKWLSKRFSYAIQNKVTNQLKSWKP